MKEADVRESREHRARVATALALGVAAVVTVAVAFQERATADFLVNLGQTPGLERDTGSAPYDFASWVDIGVALLLVGVAVLIARNGTRTWFGAGLLVDAFTLGLGLVALLSARAEVRTTLPLPVVAGLLVAVCVLGFFASLIGFASSAALPPRPPANPPVPPWHQAG